MKTIFQVITQKIQTGCCFTHCSFNVAKLPVNYIQISNLFCTKWLQFHLNWNNYVISGLHFYKVTKINSKSHLCSYSSFHIDLIVCCMFLCCYICVSDLLLFFWISIYSVEAPEMTRRKKLHFKESNIFVHIVHNGQ